LTNASYRRLDDVCDIRMGQAPHGNSYNDRGDGLPLIAGAGDFGHRVPRCKKFTTRPWKVCTSGDIILGIRASIGAKVVADRDYCLGRGVAGLRPRPGLSADYLWNWLGYAEQRLAAKGRGATFKQVSREDIGELEIPVPPIEEQRRIAEILDRADALRTKRREALAHLDALTQSIFLDMFGDPLTSSTKWPGSPLGNIAETSSGGTPSRAVRHYFGGSIPWVKSGELDEDVVLSTSECLTPAGLQHSSAKLLDAGPVLIAMYGATVGSVSRLGIRAATNQAVCAVRVGLRVRPDYLIAFLRRMTPQLLASRAGGAQPNLSQGQIQRLIIGVPPLALQDSFVEAVGRVARLRISGRCSLDYTDALSAALQQRAFAGQL